MCARVCAHYTNRTVKNRSGGKPFPMPLVAPPTPRRSLVINSGLSAFTVRLPRAWARHTGVRC